MNIINNKQIEIMANERKVGAKPKYKEGIEVITLHALVPKTRKIECLTAIDKIVRNEIR